MHGLMREGRREPALYSTQLFCETIHSDPFISQRGQERLREAAKLGFTHAIVPKVNKPKQKIEGLEIFAVERVERALEYCRGN